MAAPGDELFILLVLCSLSLVSCFRRDIFSSKTAYDWTFPQPIQTKVNEFMEMKVDEKSCRAVHVSVLARHGARQPGSKDMKKISKVHKKLLKSFTNEEFNFLHHWKNQFNEFDEKKLTEVGEDEQYELGARFGERFYDLFDDNLRKLSFISSSKQRSVESARAFHHGITEYLSEDNIPRFDPSINDIALRFHDRCNKFIQSVENNRTHMQECSKFKMSSYFQSVSQSVSERLGLQNSVLDAGELKVIYFMCAFETLMFGREEWCALLTDSEKEIIEYHSDMKQYWKKAYGHPVISEMSCPLVSAIFTSMDKVILNSMNSPGRRSNVGSFYFGHAETLAPVYAALGLYKDHQPLMSDNFEEMKNRTFRTSYILPFSANLALVLYDCHDRLRNTELREEDFALRMFVNERPVVVPACDSTVCWYPDVRNKYSSLVDKCDFDEVCHVERQRDEL